MRKLITTLITVLLLTTGPAVAAKKTVKKPVRTKKLSAASEAALRKRVIEFQTIGTDEFKKETPDIERLIDFVVPSYKGNWRSIYKAQLADGSRNRETKLTPVDVQRIIAIRVLQSKVAVDYCYVTSIRALLPDQTIPEDRSNIRLVGGRYLEYWQLVGGVWKIGATELKSELVEEAECTGAV
jgi:hypothetical protein